MGLFPLDGVKTPDLLPTVPVHNHISPFLSLGLGGREDAWANDMVDWIKARC